VYCSSSNAVDAAYFDAARELGKRIAARGDTLIYGGTDIGLMGAVARAVHAGGGRVVGVIPRAFQALSMPHDMADEIIFTQDLRERKATMEARADAFIALPGGFGTLEEVLEILTLRQIQVHTKPIILLNIQDFYTPLVTLFEGLYHKRFAKPVRALYYIAPDVADAFTYLDSYIPPSVPGKWFEPEGQ